MTKLHGAVGPVTMTEARAALVLVLFVVAALAVAVLFGRR